MVTDRHIGTRRGFQRSDLTYFFFYRGGLQLPSNSSVLSANALTTTTTPPHLAPFPRPPPRDRHVRELPLGPAEGPVGRRLDTQGFSLLPGGRTESERLRGPELWSSARISSIPAPQRGPTCTEGRGLRTRLSLQALRTRLNPRATAETATPLSTLLPSGPVASMMPSIRAKLLPLPRVCPPAPPLARQCSAVPPGGARETTRWLQADLGLQV